MFTTRRRQPGGTEEGFAAFCMIAAELNSKFCGMQGWWLLSEAMGDKAASEVALPGAWLFWLPEKEMLSAIETL